VATRRQHFEPIDAHRPCGQFDSAALTGKSVGPLAVDLDRADRRRDLRDIATIAASIASSVACCAETCCSNSPSASSVDVVWPSRTVAA
jgi:hypothetical protein